MLKSEQDDLRSRNLGRRFVLALCIAAALATLAIATKLFSEIDARVESIESVQTDNRSWTLAQIEVELLRLIVAIREASLSDPPSAAQLADLRLRFDIYFARASIFSSVSERRRLAQTPQTEQMTRHQRQFLDGNVSIVDGPDAGLIAALPAMLEQAQELHLAVRPAVLQSLSALLNESVAARAALRLTFRNFALAVVALTALMAVMIFVVLQQNSFNRRQLAASKRMLRTFEVMLEGSLDAAILVGADSRIGAYNQGAKMMLGPDGPSLLGADLFDFIEPDDLPAGDQLGKLQTLSVRGRFSVPVRSRGGRVFPAEAVVVAVPGARRVTSFVVYVRDMTETVERERGLTEARNAARHGEEAKSRFLSVMSHEMRTPLNGILATIELLRPMCHENPRATGFLDIIQRSGLAALEQVNNVLELARLDVRNGQLYPVVIFGPARHLRDLAQQNEATAMLYQNQIVIDLAPGLDDLMLRGRLALFNRVVSNFLGNALKFTSAGVVTLRLTRQDTDDPGKVRLKTVVADTGIGIDPADIERIFENFETLDSSYARAREGSGLGLGIAKLAAEQLGGKVSVTSQKGVGSEFSFEATFDLAPDEVDTAPQRRQTSGTHQAEALMTPLTVLVAEDNPINREVLTELLRADGHRVILAEDGLEAVDQARFGAPDIILMDISMPRCDGLEATRRIRASGSLVPIVAVTAMAGQDQALEFSGAGICEVVTKPISLARLREALKRGVTKGCCGVCGAPPGACAPNALDTAIADEVISTLGPEAIGRFLDRFSADLDSAESALEEHLAVAALNEAGALAHRMAGAAGVLGLRGLGETLRALQKTSEAGKHAEAQSLLARLKRERALHEAALRERIAQASSSSSPKPEKAAVTIARA